MTEDVKGAPTIDPTTTGEILPAAKRRDAVKRLLDELGPRMIALLPKHLDYARVAAVTLTAILRNPKLVEAATTSPRGRAALAGAILDAARLGVEPDGVEAAIVPFRDRGSEPLAQLLLMYRGRLKLARQTREIRTIEARVVHAEDEYRFRYGFEPTLEHVPSNKEAAGPLVAVYAIASLVNGGRQFDWMWKHEVDAIRRRSRAAHEGPWVTDYEEMAKKTVLHRLCKLLPSATEDQALIDRIEHETPPMLEEAVFDVIPGADGTAPSKLDQLTETLRGGTSAPSALPSPTTAAVPLDTSPAPAAQAAAPASPVPPASPPEPAASPSAPPATPSGMVRCPRRTCAKWVADLAAHTAMAHASGPRRGRPRKEPEVADETQGGAGVPTPPPAPAELLSARAAIAEAGPRDLDRLIEQLYGPGGLWHDPRLTPEDRRGLTRAIAARGNALDQRSPA